MRGSIPLTPTNKREVRKMMKKFPDFDMLYAAMDFIYANSTEAERTTIIKEIARGRANKGLLDNDRKLYSDRKINKKMFKKILKSF
jgi:uncharacterized pyridoxamine 5'-phosphate oxidase family protein